MKIFLMHYHPLQPCFNRRTIVSVYLVCPNRTICVSENSANLALKISFLYITSFYAKT